MLPLRCRTTGVAFRQLQAPGCRSRSLPAARHTSSIYAKHTALAIQRANTKSICAPKFSRLPQTKELSRIERLPRLACLPLSYASNLIGKRLYSTRSVRHKRYEEELEQEYGAVEPQNQEYYYGGQEHEPLPLHCIFKVLAVVTPPNFFIPVRKDVFVVSINRISKSNPCIIVAEEDLKRVCWQWICRGNSIWNKAFNKCARGCLCYNRPYSSCRIITDVPSKNQVNCTLSTEYINC